LDGTLSAARGMIRRRRRVGVLAALLVVGVGLAVGYRVWRGRWDASRAGVSDSAASAVKVDRTGSPDLEHPQGKVHISVKVIPQTAALTFGGMPVANPYDVWISAAQGKAEVVASAPGYVPRTFHVPLSEGTRLVIALDREQASLADENRAGADRSDGSRLSGRRPVSGKRGAARRGSRRSRTPAASNRSQKLDKLLDSPY